MSLEISIIILRLIYFIVKILTHDVRRIGQDFIYTKDGKINDEDLSGDLLELVQDYRIIQYDALFGKNWLGDKFYLIDE